MSIADVYKGKGEDGYVPLLRRYFDYWVRKIPTNVSISGLFGLLLPTENDIAKAFNDQWVYFLGSWALFFGYDITIGVSLEIFLVHNKMNWINILVFFYGLLFIFQGMITSVGTRLWRRRKTMIICVIHTGAIFYLTFGYSSSGMKKIINAPLFLFNNRHYAGFVNDYCDSALAFNDNNCLYTNWPLIVPIILQLWAISPLTVISAFITMSNVFCLLWTETGAACPNNISENDNKKKRHIHLPGFNIIVGALIGFGLFVNLSGVLLENITPSLVLGDYFYVSKYVEWRLLMFYVLFIGGLLSFAYSSKAVPLRIFLPCMLIVSVACLCFFVIDRIPFFPKGFNSIHSNSNPNYFPKYNNPFLDHTQIPFCKFHSANRVKKSVCQINTTFDEVCFCRCKKEGSNYERENGYECVPMCLHSGNLHSGNFCNRFFDLYSNQLVVNEDYFSYCNETSINFNTFMRYSPIAEKLLDWSVVINTFLALAAIVLIFFASCISICLCSENSE